MTRAVVRSVVAAVFARPLRADLLIDALLLDAGSGEESAAWLAMERVVRRVARGDEHLRRMREAIDVMDARPEAEDVVALATVTARALTAGDVSIAEAWAEGEIEEPPEMTGRVVCGACGGSKVVIEWRVSWKELVEERVVERTRKVVDQGAGLKLADGLGVGVRPYVYSVGADCVCVGGARPTGKGRELCGAACGGLA